MRDGDNETAADYLHKAINAYAKLPKTAAMLNNAALSQFRLYYVTGDRTAMSKALEMMDEAVVMSPSKSILLGNAASFVMSTALRDLADNAIDYNVLKTSGSIDHLAYLYDDAQSKAQLVARLGAHEGIQRAISYYERVVTLAPKSRQGYAALASISGFSDDLEQLRRLLRRIDEAEPNLSDANAQTLKYMSGEMDEEIHTVMEVDIKRLRKALGQTRASDSPVTYALAASELASQLMHQSLLQPELESDDDEYVNLARRAHTASPSVGTRQVLTGALLSRADKNLAVHEAGYKRLRDKYRRSLPPSYLIAIVLNREGSLRDAIKSDPDVNQALELIVDDINKNPDRRGGWDWAMLRFTKPEVSDGIAEFVRSSEVDRLQLSINSRLNPLSSAYAYSMFWLKQIEDDEAAGLEALRQCSEAGVPLPWKEEKANTMN